MQDNDDKLKKLFNEKHLEDDFSFDQQNWDKLSSVLKEDRKNEKRLVIYLSTLALLLGLSGVYFLNRSDKSDGQVTIVKKDGDPVLMNKNPESFLKETSSIQKETNPITHSTKQKNTNLKERAMQPLEEKTTNVKSAPAIKTSTPKIHKKEAVTIHPVSDAETRNPAKEPANLKNDLQNMQGEATPQKNEPNFTNTKHQDVAEVVKEQAENIPFTVVELPVKDEVQQPQKENAGQEPVVNVTPPVVGDTEKTQTESKPAPLVAKPESLTPVATLKVDSIPSTIAPSNILSLEVGSTYLLGWTTNGKTEANGFNPVLGLAYSTTITPKIGLSVGVQFTTVKNITATSHTSATTRIKFGEESDVTVISAKEMYYLVAPLKLTYNVNSGNIITLGYNVAYLTDVKSDVKTYTKRLGYQSDPVVSSSLGYKTGFDVFDGQLAVGYRRRIYKEMFVNGEFFYGIKDIKNNDSYGTPGFERNYGFKLTLSFALIKN
jgi:hypothetical protein